MELLAPAGNMECLKTAVQYGADAVYFAGKQFGARSFADNFSDDEIREAASYCRVRGVKSYVTVNTIATDRELYDLDRFLRVLADAGVDGVIVQDLGVLRRIREICPSMPIHGSTQMSVHNLSGVRELEKLGVERVVLARELSRKNIETILQNCQAEIEVFVHGAMCMSYSGQCLMSSVLGGRSGNRGKCAQPCRLAYHPSEGRDGFYLSLKDMSYIDHLQELKQMGVASLKIEGRMKGPSYLAAVVGTYRRCLDEGRGPKKSELEQMNRIFFRGGLTDGYWTEKSGPSMFAFDKPDNPYARNEEETFPLWERPPLMTACRGSFVEGKKPTLTLSALGREVTVVGEEPLGVAQKHGADEENIRKQLGKTGGTAVAFSPITIECKGNPFIPVKVVNGLRRQGIEALLKVLDEEARHPYFPAPMPREKRRGTNSAMQMTASVMTREQYEAIREYNFVRIDLPLSLVAEDPDFYLADRERIVLAPPVILPDSEWEEMLSSLEQLGAKGFSLLRAENIGLFSQRGKFTIHGGHRLNVTNSQALETVEKMGAETICLSVEMNLSQVRDLGGKIPCEVWGYGYLPVMITENCVIKNMKGCPCKGGEVIRDRKGMAFPVLRDGKSCRNLIFNGVPLYMGDKIEELKQSGISACRLAFSVESGAEAAEVCKRFWTGAPYEGEFTRLHYYKGVK